MVRLGLSAERGAAKNTLDALPMPGVLQPGVARYDKEIGLLP